MESKLHHGYIVTSPNGAVSLKELPVPTYATRELASKAGKASGKGFVIVAASKFYATSYGQSVRALSLKKGRIASDTKHGETVIKIQPKANPLTNLLNRLKAAKAAKASESKRASAEAKAVSDTPRKLSPEEEAEKWSRGLMRGTLERESKKSAHLADHSHLSQAFVPSGQAERKPLSDSDLFCLWNKQTPELQHEIDIAAKFAWSRGRVNKLVKSSSIKSILTLFRAGKLPEKARTYRKLHKLI